jgi:N-acetyl-anhydromuramyl-L-alanine amidase AmpD
VVWASLLGALTVVGGALLLVGGPLPRVDGLSLSPLAAAAVEGRPSDPVFNTRQKIQDHRWQAIVIHHSGGVVGSPASIEREHEARNLRGLGHHFIIGNGNGMEDGQLHIGYRWLDQLPGAHAAGENGQWFNLNAISICLVGDGNRKPFTAAQLDRLRVLLDSLSRELGIPRDQVYLHSQIAPVADPGRLFPADLALSLDSKASR